MRRGAHLPARRITCLFLTLLILLLGSGLVAAEPVPLARHGFSGTVHYQPQVGDWRPVTGVTVQLWGYTLTRPLGWKLLDSASTGRDGSFSLLSDADALEYRVVKEDPRGFAPRSAYGGGLGTIVDPNTLLFESPGDLVSGLEFVVADPLPPLVWARGHYLIVTSQTIAASSALDAFVAYKTSLGFAMQVVTVEELDPEGQGGNHLRNEIRRREQMLEAEQDLDYVLLIGTHDVVPFMAYNPGGPDLSRYDPGNPAFLPEGYPDSCSGFARTPNNCGWAGDWFYVDLTSDWDSNGDGIYGEAIWADPVALQDWYDAGVLPNNAGPDNPAGYTPDSPPDFQVDVYLGRLMIDAPEAVRNVLSNIIEFERDGGDWKSRSLLAGAMMALGGKAWVPGHPYGHYRNLPDPTDTGYLMERVWSDVLGPAGFERVTLYERESASGQAPSAFFPTAPLTREDLASQWTAMPAGLVKLAGHGSSEVIVRLFWEDDSNGNGTIENPAMPYGWEPAEYEIAEVSYIHRDNPLYMPASKRPVLMAMACSTGLWADPANMGTNLLSRGKISAWIGGTSTIGYSVGWQQPADGGGQTIDYLITEGMIEKQLPLGEAVWEGLSRAYSQGVASWGNGRWSLSFVNYDLYGDPSMRYWGNAASRTHAWPMEGADWGATGETGQLGPAPTSGSAVAVAWESPLASISGAQRAASPVISRDGAVIIGDAAGAVRRLEYGAEMWKYQTGGAIAHAAALADDGTIYVKAENGTLYALRENGTLRWSRPVGEGGGAPRLGANGLVYVGGSEPDGAGSTRRLLLAYDAGGHRLGSAVLEGAAVSSAAIDANDRVYVGTANGRLYRFSANLEEVRRATLEVSGAGIHGVAISPLSSDVLVTSSSGQLLCLNPETLDTRWGVGLGSPLRGAPSVTTDGKVYVGAEDGRVVAYSIATGDALWTANLGGVIDSAPALDPVHLFVVASDPAEVVALKRATGEVVWRVALGGGAARASSPAIGPGRMLCIVGPSDQYIPGGTSLYCLGLEQWLLSPEILTVDPRPEEIIIDIRTVDPLAMIGLESRIRGGNWSLETVLSAGVTQYVDTVFAPGQQVEYRAQAIPAGSALGSGFSALAATEPSEYSPAVLVTALPAVPGAPSAPVVATVSAHELRLTWAAVDPVAETVHVLRRGPGESAYQEVTALSAGVRAYVDRDLVPRSAYSYQLSLSNGSGQSPTSGAGDGVTRDSTLAPPTMVIAEALSNAVFYVSWTPASAGYRTVVARQALGEARPETLAEVAPGVRTYTDHVAAPYAFSYWVKHVDAAGANESPWVRTAPVPAPAFAAYMPSDPPEELSFLPLIRRR